MFKTGNESNFDSFNFFKSLKLSRWTIDCGNGLV